MGDTSKSHGSHVDKTRMQAFPVDQILDNSSTDFDLFLEAAGGLTLYAQATYKWSKDELTRLLANGHQSLFYRQTETPRVDFYRRIHKQVQVDVLSHPRLRILNLTEAAAELTRVLYEYDVTPVVIAKAADVAVAMVQCVKQDPTCITALGQLVQHDEYTYYHSARVGAYALAIAVQLSQSDETKLAAMATGALLHDVGKARVDRKVLDKRGALTPPEWDEMRLHPVHGDAMVAESQLSVVPRQIILHHHERLDGTGYPHKLTGKELLEEVKIVAFADVFDALTTSRPYQVCRSRFEALAFIRDRLLANLHSDSYNALVEILAGRVKQSA